jgi:hypothetical protein
MLLLLRCLAVYLKCQPAWKLQKKRFVPSNCTHALTLADAQEAHIQEAIKRSLNSMTAHLETGVVDIPTPTVRVVEGYDEAPNPNPFEKTTVYIKFKGVHTHRTVCSDKTYLQLAGYDDELVDYDMDTDDEEFLNKFNATSGKKPVTEDNFEWIMDRLEREADRTVSEGRLLDEAMCTDACFVIRV